MWWLKWEKSNNYIIFKQNFLSYILKNVKHIKNISKTYLKREQRINILILSKIFKISSQLFYISNKYGVDAKS